MSNEAVVDLKMNIARRELQVLLLYEFRLDHKATEAVNYIYSTIGKDMLSILIA